MGGTGYGGKGVVIGRALAWAVLALAGLALLAGYGGALHPAGDALAVFRPVFALLLLAAGLVLRGRAGWGATLLALLAVLPILWALRPLSPPEHGLVVYQKNLLFTLADPGPIAGDIAASGADLVMLEEVSPRNLALPEALRAAYPHQHICGAHSVGGVAILSRHPFAVPPRCDAPRGMATARIETPWGEVSAAVLHLHWPWPFGQAAHVRRLLPVLADLPRPVIVAGDFNMVHWGQSTRVLARATGTARVGPLRETFRLKRAYPMAIDHVLAPEGWRAAGIVRPRLGSDHRGIVARLAPED